MYEFGKNASRMGSSKKATYVADKVEHLKMHI